MTSIPRLTVVIFLSLLGVGEGTAQHAPIDFRYSPAEYWTIIGFPDDWQKTLVNERGALCYDFGPGPYARPLTQISVGIAGAPSSRGRQFLERPKAPVISTVLTTDSSTARLTTFALVPRLLEPIATSWRGDSIRRVGGMNGWIGWVNQSDSVDPLFRNAAWGPNRPILYRVRIEPFGERRVALGLCEPYKSRSGMRQLELVVEGAPPQVVEPVPNNVRNLPLAFLFSGKDEDGDGWLRLEVHAAGPDPNIFLNAFWLLPAGDPITPEEVISGTASRRALLMHPCGTEREMLASSPRADGIIAEFSPGVRPEVTVQTRRALRPPRTRTHPSLSWEGEPYLLSSPLPLSIDSIPGGWRLSYPADTRTLRVTVIHGNRGPDQIISPPDLRREAARAITEWEGDRFGIPCSMQVPDSALQLLLDASLRTPYQVREPVEGLRQLQPGPTVYRGLWIGDASVTGIPLALMGDPGTMRTCLEAGLPFQQPSGQIRVLRPMEATAETPVWAHAALWYLRATGDTAWFNRNSAAIARALDWVCALRDRSLADPAAVYAGLIPPGFVDGGISTPMADYGTLWWCILALDEGIRTPHFASDARRRKWIATRDGFLSSLQIAARRDIRADRAGRPFLPVGVGDTSTTQPQLGQFSIVLPIRYERFAGPIGAFLDTVARMNLRMLDGYLAQGLVLNAGWLRDGVWPWLGGAIGIAHQRLGRSDRALEFLHAYANHASPTGVWVEEQIIKEKGEGSTGDVSNAEASAIYLHLLRYLLVTERGDALEFLGGLPASWLRPGSQTSLTNALSEFGRFSLTLTVSPDGRSGRLQISPIVGTRHPRSISCSLSALRKGGFKRTDGSPLPARIRFSATSGLNLDFRLQ